MLLCTGTEHCSLCTLKEIEYVFVICFIITSDFPLAYVSSLLCSSALLNTSSLISLAQFLVNHQTSTLPDILKFYCNSLSLDEPFSLQLTILPLLPSISFTGILAAMLISASSFSNLPVSSVLLIDLSLSLVSLKQLF